MTNPLDAPGCHGSFEVHADGSLTKHFSAALTSVPAQLQFDDHDVLSQRNIAVTSFRGAATLNTFDCSAVGAGPRLFGLVADLGINDALV